MWIGVTAGLNCAWPTSSRKTQGRTAVRLTTSTGKRSPAAGYASEVMSPVGAACT